MVMIDDRQTLAGQALDAAFEAPDGAAAGLDRPLVGIFGHGAPETLISASGAVPVHVNFGRLDGSGVGAIDQLIEPFVDHEVRIFLNRFAAGAFTGFAGIVFVRDDAAALTAYQYATEWVRQGRAPRGTPPLFLFNLVHAASDPVRTFNDIQIEKLVSFLTAIGLDDPRPDWPERQRRQSVASVRSSASHTPPAGHGPWSGAMPAASLRQSGTPTCLKRQSSRTRALPRPCGSALWVGACVRRCLCGLRRFR